jgi:hypothetical protein
MVENFIALKKDPAVSKLLKSSDPKRGAEFEAAKFKALIKRHDFSSSNDLDVVATNIYMIMNSLDPQSGQYTDPADSLKRGMSEVMKNPSLDEKEKSKSSTPWRTR